MLQGTLPKCKKLWQQEELTSVYVVAEISNSLQYPKQCSILMIHEKPQQQQQQQQYQLLVRM